MKGPGFATTWLSSGFGDMDESMEVGTGHQLGPRERLA